MLVFCPVSLSVPGRGGLALVHPVWEQGTWRAAWMVEDPGPVMRSFRRKWGG